MRGRGVTLSRVRNGPGEPSRVFFCARLRGGQSLSFKRAHRADVEWLRQRVHWGRACGRARLGLRAARRANTHEKAARVRGQSSPLLGGASVSAAWDVGTGQGQACQAGWRTPGRSWRSRLRGAPRRRSPSQSATRVSRGVKVRGSVPARGGRALRSVPALSAPGSKRPARRPSLKLNGAI